MKAFRTAAMAALFLGASAQGSMIVYDASLTGAAESPPTGSPGTGFAIVTINTIAQTIEVNVVFSGLFGPTTASHIHCCTAAPGTGNAGVATTTPSFVGFPLGVTAGSFDMTYDLTASGTYNPAFVTMYGSVANAEAALLAGLAAGETYLNIHSTVDPGGEIRGYLVATPEPATMVMAGLALAGLVMRRKARVGDNRDSLPEVIG
jgi:hypothetical protein